MCPPARAPFPWVLGWDATLALASTTHRPPWRGSQGWHAHAGLCDTYMGVSRACTEFTLHTSRRQVRNGEERACVPGAAGWSSLLEAPAPVGASCASRAQSAYLCTMGNTGWPPLAPFLQEERGSGELQPKPPAEMLFSKGLAFLQSSLSLASDPGFSSPKITSELLRSSGDRLPGVNPSSAQLCDLLKPSPHRASVSSSVN